MQVDLVKSSHKNPILKKKSDFGEKSDLSHASKTKFAVFHLAKKRGVM
jgi:hypothetical protein